MFSYFFKLNYEPSCFDALYYLLNIIDFSKNNLENNLNYLYKP